MFCRNSREKKGRKGRGGRDSCRVFPLRGVFREFSSLSARKKEGKRQEPSLIDLEEHFCCPASLLLHGKGRREEEEEERNPLCVRFQRGSSSTSPPSRAGYPTKVRKRKGRGKAVLRNHSFDLNQGGSSKLHLSYISDVGTEGRGGGKKGGGESAHECLSQANCSPLCN